MRCKKCQKYHTCRYHVCSFKLQTYQKSKTHFRPRLRPGSRWAGEGTIPFPPRRFRRLDLGTERRPRRLRRLGSKAPCNQKFPTTPMGIDASTICIYLI